MKYPISLSQLLAQVTRTLLGLRKQIKAWELKPADPEAGTVALDSDLYNFLVRTSDQIKLPYIGCIWVFYLYTCLVQSGKFGLNENYDLVWCDKFQGPCFPLDHHALALLSNPEYDFTCQ